MENQEGKETLKDKEFITLCKALDLKQNDGIVITKFTDTEQRVVLVVDRIMKDPETGVAFVQSNKGNVILASEIYSLERNRSLKGSAKEK